MTSVSVSQDDTSDQLLTDYPLVGSYEGPHLKHGAVQYISLAFPVFAQYVLLQADWDADGVFGFSEIRFLRGKRFISFSF